MKKFYFLSLITFFIFIFTGKAPESQDIPNKITVGVAVDCKDKSAKNLIENNIKKELRQLRDVVIIEPEKKVSNYIIFSSVVEHRDTFGRKNGGISLVSHSLEPISLYSRLKPHLSREKHKELFIETGELPIYIQRYIATYIVTGEITELNNHCKMVVDNFETNVLEKTRKIE